MKIDSDVLNSREDELEPLRKRIAELEAENKRLREASKWRPIETAPMDIVILVKHKNLGWVEGVLNSDMFNSTNDMYKEHPWDISFHDLWLYTKDMLGWLPLPESPKEQTND